MIHLDSHMSQLSDYVRQKLAEKNLSGDQVRRRSGDTISQSSVNRIANGVLRDPSVGRLRLIGIYMTGAEIMFYYAVYAGAEAEQLLRYRFEGPLPTLLLSGNFLTSRIIEIHKR